MADMPNYCIECEDEAFKASPRQQIRAKSPLECNRHGDPRTDEDIIVIAMWMYGQMPREECRKGDKVYLLPQVDVMMVSELCRLVGYDGQELLILSILEEINRACH